MPVLIVAGLGAAAVGLLATLLALGISLFGRTLASFIPADLPIIRGALRAAVLTATVGVSHAMGRVWDAAAGPLAHVIEYPVAMFENLITGIRDAMTAVVTTEWYITTVLVPRALHAAAVTAQHMAQGAWDHADRNYHRATAYAHAAAKGAWDHADRLYNDGIAYAHAAAKGAWDHADSNYHRGLAHAAAYAAAARAAGIAAAKGAWDHADAVGKSAEGHADAVGRAAETYAAGVAGSAALAAERVAGKALSDAVDAADTAVASGLADVWQPLAGWASEAAGVAGVDFPDVAATLESLLGTRVDGAADATAALAGLAGVGLELAARCVMPNCRNLGAFGRDLSAILTGWNDAAMLEWLIGMIADPKGSAEDIYDELMGGVESIANDVMSLVPGL